MTGYLVSSGPGKTKRLCPGDKGPAALRSLYMTHVLSGRWKDREDPQEDPLPCHTLSRLNHRTSGPGPTSPGVQTPGNAGKVVLGILTTCVTTAGGTGLPFVSL